jgi:hypothetical protein
MIFDIGGLIVYGLITTILLSGFYVFIFGFVYGLVGSLIFNIRRAFSSGLRVSLIGSCLCQLIFVYVVYKQGWSDCLTSTELMGCIAPAAGAAPIILAVYTVAVVLSIPFGMLGISFGVFLRYIAGIIVGTYRFPDFKTLHW